MMFLSWFHVTLLYLCGILHHWLKFWLIKLIDIEMFARFIIACLLRFFYVSGIMQQTIWCLTGQVWNSMIYLIIVVPMDSIKCTISHPFAYYLLSTTINSDYFSIFAINFVRIKKTYHSYSNNLTIFWAINIFCLKQVGCGAGNTTFPLLATYPDLFVYACDFSPRAVNLVKVWFSCFPLLNHWQIFMTECMWKLCSYCILRMVKMNLEELCFKVIHLE